MATATTRTRRTSPRRSATRAPTRSPRRTCRRCPGSWTGSPPRRTTSPARLPIYLTEFGYETDPPDPFSGQTLGDQAAYVAQGDFLAWREARVASQTQFLLRDVAPLTRYPKGTKRYWFTYQSGLFFADGRPKPSATAYAFPLVARPGGGSVWGHLRPRPGDPVTLELSRDGGTAYAPVGPPVATDGRGFFTATLPAGTSGLLRALDGRPAPFALTSLPVRVG